MNDKKQSPRLQSAASQKPNESTIHVNAASGPIVKTGAYAISPPYRETSEEPTSTPSLWGKYIPVALYRLDDGTLSPSCICFDIRNKGETPAWAYVDRENIPFHWLANLSVVSRADGDLLLPPFIEATLERLRGYGYVEDVREVVAWASSRGYSQSDFWGVLYDDVR